MKKSHRARLNLLFDLTRQDCAFAGQPIEVASNFVLTMFPDIEMTTWCRAADVKFVINKNPDPAFRSPTTVIFYYDPPIILPEAIDEDEY